MGHVGEQRHAGKHIISAIEALLHGRASDTHRNRRVPQLDQSACSKSHVVEWLPAASADLVIYIGIFSVTWRHDFVTRPLARGTSAGSKFR